MNDNQHESPATGAGQPSVDLTEPKDSSPAFKLRWWTVILSVCVWWLAYGVGWSGTTGSQPHLELILIASISSVWMYRDAKKKGINIVGAIQFLLFFAWMIAVPIYLVYSRGKIGVAWAVLQILAVSGAWYTGMQLHR